MTSLRSWIFDKYLPVNLTVRNPRTRENYRYALAAFAAFLGREPELSDLTDETVAAFINWMHLDRGMAETTVNGYAAKLRAFWEWAARKKHVDQFPTVTRIPVPERMPAAWREDELVKIFNACRMQRGYIGDVPAWRWWFTIHAWWWSTGERIGATLAMRVEHLRLDQGIAALPAGIRKGRCKGAVHHLWPELVEMFRQILPPHTKPREIVFEWDDHHDRGTFYNRYKAMLRRVGLPTNRYRMPHAMRVSHASWLDLMGGDATKSLGHADRATTDKSYLDKTLAPAPARKLFLGV